MRRFILTAAFVALTPLAYAQSTTGMPGSMDAPGISGSPSGMRDAGSAAPMSASSPTGQLDPTNCGTPDEPKPCGPMPRRALKHFPASRSGDSG